MARTASSSPRLATTSIRSCDSERRTAWADQVVRADNVVQMAVETSELRQYRDASEHLQRLLTILWAMLRDKKPWHDPQTAPKDPLPPSTAAYYRHRSLP